MKKTYNLILENLRKYVPINIFRGGQETVYTNICDAIVKGIRTMYIEGPTGMGKSFIQSTLADAIINGSDIQVLLLVPKITLLSQMQREFVKFTKHLLLGLVGAGQKSYHNQVTVMTYQSFVKLKRNDILKRYSVFFLDEAHKALGPKTRTRIEEQKHAIVIGFTATPTYSEKKNLKEFLKYEAYRISIPEAVKVGMLSAIQFIIGKVKIEISGRKKGESPQEYLDRMGKDIIRQGGNIAATKLYKRIFKKRGTRFIMFTVSVNQGYDLVRELRSSGISAKIITGEMNLIQRKKLFLQFSQNKFKVLVGIDTIKEGFDDPGVHGVLFAYPIGTIVGLIQGAGRSTRIDELFPNKIAYIVQLMFQGKKQVWYNDALEGLGPFVAPEEEFSSNIKKKREFNPISQSDLIGITDEVIESVSVDHEEILNLISRNSSKGDLYSTWREASDACKKQKIDSSTKYFKFFRIDPKLPPKPEEYYQDFPNWYEFFGKEKLNFYGTWQQASKAAIKLGIKIQLQYLKDYKKDRKLPSNPHVVYTDFPGWAKFLGKEKKVFYKTWRQAAKAAIKLGITSTIEYKLLSKKDPRLPSNPNAVYKDFPGYPKFLSKEIKVFYKTWRQAARAIKRLEIKNQSEYKKNYKKDLLLPASPDAFYKDFPGWPIFSGKRKENYYETCRQASKASIKLKIVSGGKYKKDREKDLKLPKRPEKYYKDFPGWKKFLGK